MCKNVVLFGDFLLKWTRVHPKCVSWRSNQEWHSIGADTVDFSYSLSTLMYRSPASLFDSIGYKLASGYQFNLVTVGDFRDHSHITWLQASQINS